MANATLSKDASIGDSTLYEQFHELSQLCCKDREAKLQVFCESFWDRLERSPRPIDALLLAFTTLLASDNNLPLVQLVIPNLQPAAVIPTNSLKRDLVRRFQGRQPLFELSSSYHRTRHSEAHHQFKEEKKALQEAELYRASILLCGHGNPSEAYKERVRQWLLGFPKEDV
ncbi:hypothetical protein ACJQWK_10936 [Exserohilum turcicum]|uniref:Uncharacterized protein n=1 Tax=Exserohilum turcicum (strain 28A) TaxID=671987 RepID=R0I8J8_EXST2|nr:uncharacterized protein SETTUDRAFT_24104 [Exserohilum turcica Et28A]EOA81716.1 hypothetical protein SETTUDRAFT_24104 [Exserohilum turcica Et28A]